MTSPRGTVVGKEFEQHFAKQAMMQGFRARKMPLSCRNKSGEFQVIRSELDFQLVDPRTRRVAFVDTKTYVDERVTFARIEPHQIDRAVWYNEGGITAGFVVWFRTLDLVVFYSGLQVRESGARSSLKPEDGLELGGLLRFDLSRLFP